MLNVPLRKLTGSRAKDLGAREAGPRGRRELERRPHGQEATGLGPVTHSYCQDGAGRDRPAPHGLSASVPRSMVI